MYVYARATARCRGLASSQSFIVARARRTGATGASPERRLYARHRKRRRWISFARARRSREPLASESHRLACASTRFCVVPPVVVADDRFDDADHDDEEKTARGAMVTTMLPALRLSVLNLRLVDGSAYRDVRQRGRLDTRRFSLHATRFCPVRRNPGGIKLHGDQKYPFRVVLLFFTIKFFVDDRRRGVLVRFYMTFLDPGRENGKVHERYLSFLDRRHPPRRPRDAPAMFYRRSEDVCVLFCFVVVSSDRRGQNRDLSRPFVERVAAFVTSIRIAKHFFSEDSSFIYFILLHRWPDE